MQALDDNFFYSNSRLAHGDLEKEKQLLAEEQKLCRARARKFSLDTQRRRKALEERRKQWDVHEQRIRENALQERRQKVQEATERFQRAHLPPSQRRRQSSKRNVPTLEDALNNIQGCLRSDNHQSSFVSISRNHTPSPKTSSKVKSSPQHALSAVEAYTKLLQERSFISLRNNPDIHETQQKPSDSSPQEDSLSDCIHSESISSKDSLDSEEPKNGTKYIYSLSPAFLLDTDKCISDLKKNFQQPTYPPETAMGDALTQSRKLHDLKLKKQIDYDLLKNKNGVNNCSWGTAKNEKASKLYSTGHCSSKSTKNSTNDSLIVLTSTPHINTEPDTRSPKLESALDLRQPKANDDRQLKHPPATEILLPTKNGNSTDYLFGASKPNVVLNNCIMDYTCQEGALEQAGKDNLCVSSQKELSASINNLNKFSDADDKAEKKKVNTELIHHTCLNSNQTSSFKCLKCCEKEELLSPVSSENSQRICGLQFIKGILKKQSKYISRDAACVCNSGQQLTLTKQVVLAIRDSVELTRAKNRDLENNTAVKKKLRWFDEVHVDSEDKGQNAIKQIRSKSSSLLHSKNNSEDHQLSIATVLGAMKTGPSMTQAVPNGYHFTRHAWADVGVQVSLPQQHGDEVKVQQGNNKGSGLKASTKERTEAAPVSSRTRKGIHIRPQSATEVSQIARAHGRLVMPRPPPPRMDAIEEQKGLVTTAPYGTDHAKVSKPSEDRLESSNPVYTNNEYRTDNAFLFMPHPPSYTCTTAESNSKPKHRFSHHDTRAGMRHSEKGSCLKCTPTEEEISQLWLGVRAALATKDAQTALRQQVVDSAQKGRKNSATLGVRKPSYSTQPIKQTPDPDKQFSFAPAFCDRDSFRFGHLSKDEIQNGGQQSWVDTKDPQRHEALHQRHQQGITTISMEEERILQSLDRLNHRLHCEHGVVVYVWLTASGELNDISPKQHNTQKPNKKGQEQEA
ncbi:centrosomal protein of 126 kDa [Periophthalmus magnuspinnatus]|uniref:centrosomal protein of 126 kDa n=1 Tax=Periophthalmus magnuspinnatus TaxID=409849 RepID=UPI002436F4BB|nr:centrosomal protein of 126 kDa [Periophthalmus magnuspinnatus]